MTGGSSESVRVAPLRRRAWIAWLSGAGVLVLAGVIPWWLVVVLALGSLGAYAAWGRQNENPDVRVVTWTAAVSQLIVVLVPVLAGAVVVLAAVAVVACAALALAALLLDRR